MSSIDRHATVSRRHGSPDVVEIREIWIVSKGAGATWRRPLSPVRRDFADRAWAGRPNLELSIRRPAAPEDFARILEFVRYWLSTPTGR